MTTPNHSFFSDHCEGIKGDVIALVAGALLTLAYAPFHFYPLALLAPVLLLRSWNKTTPWRAARRGFLFGLGHFGTGVYWVYISLYTYGQAPLAFAIIAALLLVLYLSLYPMLVGYVLTRSALKDSPVKWLLLAPALWVFAEWIRSWLLSGFPWLALGYSQTDSALGNIAPYLGVFGISWVLMLCAGLLFLVIKSPRRQRWLWTLALIAVSFSSWGLIKFQWVTPIGEPLRVSLVQGNIEQDKKFLPEIRAKTLQVYRDLSEQVSTESDLIVWPETAIPIFFSELDPDYLSWFEQQALTQQTDYLTGVPAGDWRNGIYYNGVVSLGSSHGFYYKHRLLPFGEYLPLRFLFNLFHRLVDIPMADFTPGDANQTLLQAAGHAIGVSICFEAVFGSEIRRTLPQARFLVNVSNDAWFGDSPAPHQHLQIARMRAMETGRSMARATNTGISALINHRGHIIAQSNPFVAEVLQGKLQPMQGSTPYVLAGDWPIVIFAILLLIIGFVITRNEEYTAASPA